MGTGTPYSVTEIVNAFEEANGIKVKHEFGLVKMCRDTWNWQKNNPEGYR